MQNKICNIAKSVRAYIVLSRHYFVPTKTFLKCFQDIFCAHVRDRNYFPIKLSKETPHSPTLCHCNFLDVKLEDEIG